MNSTFLGSANSSFIYLFRYRYNNIIYLEAITGFYTLPSVTTPFIFYLGRSQDLGTFLVKLDAVAAYFTNSA